MPYRGTLSNKKIKKYLNYTPIYNLERGLQKLISWYKKNYINELSK